MSKTTPEREPACTSNSPETPLAQHTGLAAGDVERAVAEILRLGEAVARGSLDERGDPSLFAGAPAELIQTVNLLLDGLVKPLRIASGALEQIAHGRIPDFIIDDYRGEFDQIKRNVNKFLAVMYGMHNELGNFVAAIQEGKLATRGNDWDFQGKWRDLIAGLNAVVDAFMRPFSVSTDYMNRISRGDIPEPIRDRYKGDFNQVRRSLNVLIGAVGALVADSNQLCEAAAAGNLTKRVDASRHGGDFRKIVDGVNRAMDAVVGPLGHSATVLKEVSRGNLTQELEGEFQGAFAALQQDINVMVRRLRASLVEITETARGLASASEQMSAISLELTGSAGETALQAASASSSSQQVAATVREITAASERVARAAQQVAANTQQASRITTEAVGRAQWAGGTVTQLKHISGDALQVVEEISAITQQTGALAATVDEKAAQAGGAARGFGVVATEVNRLARETSEAAGGISERTDSMRAVVNRMAAATQDVGSAGDALRALSAASQEIGKATGSLSKIAFTSRMLALNAAIEAARGEAAGSSIGIVAAEVKSLSTRIGDAAGRIDRFLGGVRGDSEQAVAAIDEIGELIRRIDSIMSEMAGVVREQASATDRIGGDLGTVADAAQDIVMSISGVAAAARRTTDVAGQTREASSGLQQAAQRLEKLVGGFVV